MAIQGPPRERDRVRLGTSGVLNERIDHRTAQRVEEYVSRPHSEIASRIEALDRQWSLERVFYLATAAAGLAGIGLAAAGRRRPGLGMATAAGLMSVRFSLFTKCLFISLLRRAGLRSRREIDAEKFALKAVRGDFDAVCSTTNPIARAGNALQAIGR